MEAEELFTSEGLLDLSLSGRKKAKKRLSIKKKQKEAEQKKARAELLKQERAIAAKKRQEMKQKKKSMQEAANKARAQANKEARELKRLEKEREKEERKEQRELERMKRKKEKEQKEEEQKSKKRRLSMGSAHSSRSSKKRKRSDKSPKKENPKSRKRGGRSKSTGIPNKKSRAEAVVRNFIARIVHNEEKKGSGITGMVTAPSSGIASYGLLGMALAFRAAAGVINFPDTGKTEKVLRPWEKIDADSAATSAERCEQLRKQIQLLEKDIDKFLGYEEKRKQLIEDAEERKHTNFKKIKAMDKEARAVCERYAKTRKKSIGTPSGKGNGRSRKQGKSDAKSTTSGSRKSELSPPKRKTQHKEKDETDDEYDDLVQEQMQDDGNDEGIVEVEEAADSDVGSGSEEENEEVAPVGQQRIDDQFDDAEDDSE